MSSRLDPLRLSNQLDERYRQYLQTRFQFKDPQLRRSFESRLRSSPLTKGPYLEATPLFKKAGGVESLFQDLLGKEVEPEFARAAGGERELYTHQAQALHSVHSGHNVIVATGTGSGKTEAFLLPILLHLYREHLEGRREPGVRALILYPMNALANDQRDRLGQICQRLQEEGSSFSFTFGQYTGDTPADLHDARRRASERERDRLAGELVFRSEMTETPPDILLTNYSMLEYLLLRPSDSPLFDGGRAKYWTFIVLDEAHQYRGAKGIEMGMLLRRLKRRLREGGREGPFRCIATSATLADDDPESRKAVAAFAAELFGESFQEQDVITGDVLPVPESSGKRLKPDCYAGLLAALDSTSAPDGRVIADAASEVGVTLPQGLPAEQSIARILERDQRSEELRRTVTGKPVLVRELAAQLFPELAADRQVEALGTLVTLLCSARNAPAGTPLLTARYHLFVRALEGAFLRFWPQRELLLERESQDTKNPTFEVALCHECGQHYLVVGKLPLRARAGIVSPPVVDPGHPDCGATYLMPLDEEQLPEDVDDDQDSGADRAEDSQNDVLHLCGRCGAYRKGAQPCDHSEAVVQVLRIANSERTDAPQKCASCGYTGGARDPVREVVHGADGPNAVIATTLFQELPEDRRKVLAFADGRQEAAFFAWYLEETCQDLLDRHILLKVLRAHSGGPASLATLHAWLCAEEGQSFRLRESDDQATIQRNAWRAILREFLTEERRLCLEGVGLVRWPVEWPESFQGAALLMSAPFSLSQPEALAVLEVLVNTMRLDLAVDIPSEIGVSWNDLGVSFTPKPYHGTNGNGGKFRIWTGSRAARADYLRRLAESNGGTCSPAHIEGCLIAIWHEMLDVANRLQDSRDGLLKQTGNGGYLLNPAWWRVSAVPPDTPLYRCDTCGRLQHVSVRGVCPRRGCPGKLGPVAAKDLEENHYRRLYKEGLPRRMRVEEHTAQIEHDEARRFQDDFKRGAINVLSCSTTFELGVDLGDLDAVFLRNVPPEGFNYTQRVGRAGRRPGYPGFAVTYCRRSSHDLYHFAEPERILAGSIRPPALEMTNHKVILRHIVAVVLSAFFRNHPDRFANVKALLGDMLAPRAADDIEAFARQMRQSLESSLAGIVPPAVWSSPDLANGEWIRRVAGGWKEVKTPGEVIHESRLRLAEAEANADYKAVHDLQVQAASEERQDYRTAAWAKRRKETLEREDVLSFLSRKAVIPKYGFPVDVVELDLQQDRQTHAGVQLQRDLRLAIAEFAPSAKVMANKKVWRSYALKRVPDREWPRYCYMRCTQHNLFHYWHPGTQPDGPERCCSQAREGVMVVPLFGFISQRGQSESPTGRTERLFTTRPYFCGFIGPEAGGEVQFGPVTISQARPGQLVVVNEGRKGAGLQLCGRCGAAFPALVPSHKTPYGSECNAQADQRVALGHLFVTDVVRLSFNTPVPAVPSGCEFGPSLAYALVEGAAEALDVASSDLHCAMGARDVTDADAGIFLYDDVPGGAGLVARLTERGVLRECLQAALERVDGRCGCGEDASCYGCLRSYRNQFVHQSLVRGPVRRFLEDVLSAM